MLPRLQNKIAVITGSSSGIGRATALAFASEGASLVCSDIHETPRQEYATDTSPQATTVQAAQDLGAKALFVKCDTTSSSDMQALIQTAVQEYGRIDIMVNNAGISMETSEHGSRPVWEYEEAAFERTLDVNVKGVFLGTKYASRQMVAQEPGPGGDRGWIINLSSVYGMRASMGICEFILFSFSLLAWKGKCESTRKMDS
jgi:NAD(P)-dependent dehydrogenase (short-subunit alcohol dehydrogenase family)